jgi:hypothetical protein
MMLTYTVSLDLHLPSYITIHNQCSSIELVSPVFFGDGVICPKLFSQRVGIDTKMKAHFEIYATQDNFEGAFLFKLQRFSEWYNMYTSMNEAEHIYMLIAWKMKGDELSAYVALVKHTKAFTWDKDKLRKLYNKNRNWLEKYDGGIFNTWLVDNMVLTTLFGARVLKRILELEIHISRGRDNLGINSLFIDTER